MEVRDQVLGVLRVEIDRRHHAVTLDNDDANAVIIRRSSAGQILLFEDAEHRRTVQSIRVAIVVALRTAGLKDSVAAHLLRVELVQRRRWWRCGLAANQNRVENEKRAQGKPRLAGWYGQIQLGSFSCFGITVRRV